VRATANGMKVCSKCRLNREVAWFCKNKDRSDGLNNECSECMRKRKRELLQRNKLTRKVRLEGSKVCTKCEETKDINEFHAHVMMRDGRDSNCNSCNRASCIKRYWKNPEVSREKSKEYNHDYYWKSDGKLMRALRAQEKRLETA
jgi:hypothetical protein